ncbi:MAG TPA: subclass B1 metallo-beta-lactamase, partial [Saprospirales bacterium]|nr:subclass B1 metallo-beta-lactamase [Saprospirales bacterium]
MRFSFFALALCFILTQLRAQSEADKLVISHLTGDFYIYTTFNQYEDSRVMANGMYLVTNSGVVMIDTPWDTTQ